MLQQSIHSLDLADKLGPDRNWAEVVGLVDVIGATDWGHRLAEQRFRGLQHGKERSPGREGTPSVYVIFDPGSWTLVSAEEVADLHRPPRFVPERHPNGCVFMEKGPQGCGKR